MKDFFCPNCGTKLKAGTKFCPNCGHNVERFTKNSNDSNQDTDYIQGARRESSRTVKSFTQKWGSNKKRNNIILAIIILLIVFLTWGHFYYQEDNQMNRATTAIGDPDKAAAKYVTSTTSQVKINNSTVKPIQIYFQKYPGDLNSLKQKFSEGEKWNDYQFIQKGRAWLIWPRYKIQAEPNYITVNTDQKGMLIKMDGKSLGTVTSNTNTSDNGTSDVNSSDSSNSSYSRSFGPYLPGLHTFVGTKNVDGHQLKTTLISSDDTITINNGISNDNAQSLLSGVFQNNVDDEDESFVDGQNNTGYKQLVKMFDGFQDDDGIRSYNAKVNVNSVTPISDKKFKVNYQVKFTFDNQNNDDDDNSTKKIQVFKYTGTIVKTNDQNSNNGLKIKDLGHAKKVSESNEHED
ncbi:zinc-ribbon domain-containing protein [Limosilactobacillus vaginalis]|uniref:zinc-ribbon domain-containing protein n=1 Tax=Limosilactobacillus vaginalis TaxID=1633 RepID=UPI0023592EAD|nr:zinc-ribbon domain-containing protein [Limosilactobacillus vaginalis]WCT58420.1 zinc-ribbon domain-containing protein [Limosilactobacillus vaginalis]